ncbi:MAG: hypothetical protein HFH37_13575 [Lachnospiraceae bacterium]|nr:hypothetical protein [Lachnospiraceae bacterium]
MTQEEMSDLYIRIAFHYESTIDRLVGKGLLDKDFVDSHRKTFYDSLDEEKLRTSQKIRSQTEIMQRYERAMICGDMVSLTKIAKQYTEDSPGYVIQSWMRSRNTLEFLRQWENDMNGGFDDSACEELIHEAHTTSLTVTPSLWIRRTHAVGMYVKQGKGGGVKAYSEIAADFRLWLDPAERLALVRVVRDIKVD